MLREANGRLAILCDNCPAQLDLGPAGVARVRNRTPSAWINAGDGRHYCPYCTPRVTAALMAQKRRQGTRPQPLIN
jgi:hypothetical protein